MSKPTVNTDSKQMSDVARAQSYIADIGGPGSVKAVLGTAYKRLVDMFPHDDDPKKQWTERRVRGFWTKEAATVQFYEMIELHVAAAKAKEERELLRKARKEHADFIEKTASIRALLERTDADFFGGEIERLGGGPRRMDRPGTDGG